MSARESGPRVVGVNRTQDGSICVLDGSSVVCCIQKERLSRQKHHWGRLGDLRDFYRNAIAGLDERPVDALVECFSSDREIERLDQYDDELRETLKFSPGAKRARISHHLSHLYSVFPLSPFDEAAVMIVDGQGSPASQFDERWPGSDRVPGHWREVSSFYRVDRGGGIDCLDKQLWAGDEDEPVGLGMFYFLLTQAMFPGEGNEGKVMGLAPHGNPDAFGLPPLEVDGFAVAIPPAWREIVAVRPRFRYDPNDRSRFEDIANLAAAGQRAFEEAPSRGIPARVLHRPRRARRRRAARAASADDQRRPRRVLERADARARRSLRRAGRQRLLLRCEPVLVAHPSRRRRRRDGLPPGRAARRFRPLVAANGRRASRGRDDRRQLSGCRKRCRTRFLPAPRPVVKRRCAPRWTKAG